MKFTGEFWEGPQYKPIDYSESYSQSEVYAEMICPDGRVVAGQEAENLFELLMSGEGISFEWHEATEGNVRIFFK